MEMRSTTIRLTVVMQGFCLLVNLLTIYLIEGIIELKVSYSSSLLSDTCFQNPKVRIQSDIFEICADTHGHRNFFSVSTASSSLLMSTQTFKITLRLL